MTAQDLSYLPNISNGYATSLWHTIDNRYTGNLDLERQGLLQEREMLYNANEAQKAREFSSTEAEKNREFERAMSNTAYQRAFADMKSAGLNPYLMYNQGGASTPSGSMATPTSASVGSKSALGVKGDVISDIFSAIKVAGEVAKTFLGKGKMK